MLTHSADQQIRNLWAAVLKRAVDDATITNEDLVGMHPNERYYAKIYRARAIAWIENIGRYTSSDIGSFPWVCQVLGLDRDHVRMLALKNKPKLSHATGVCYMPGCERAIQVKKHDLCYRCYRRQRDAGKIVIKSKKRLDTPKTMV